MALAEIPLADLLPEKILDICEAFRPLTKIATGLPQYFDVIDDARRTLTADLQPLVDAAEKG